MNVKRILGLAAIAGLLMMAAPAQRAEAVSLSSPGIAAAVQDDAGKLTTEVRWHHGWHHHYGWHRHWRWHRHYHWRHHHWHRHHWHHRHWRRHWY
jgi:hypothetical protein